MSWWDDVKNTIKTAWDTNVPWFVGSPIPFAGQNPSLKDLAATGLGLGSTAAALTALKPFAGMWQGPRPPRPPNGPQSTVSDRPRPSMLDQIAPGTRRYNPYTGQYSRGKTLRQTIGEAALKESVKAARGYAKRRKARKSTRARKSRPRATSTRRAAPRRRSSRPPTAKQLAARRAFAKMARARAAARRAG